MAKFYFYRKHSRKSQCTSEQFQPVRVQKRVDLLDEDENDALAAADPRRENQAPKFEPFELQEEANHRLEVAR